MITIEKYFVNSVHQSDAELTCIVHAYPTPSINWKKDGENIFQTNRIELRQKKHATHTENILVIRNLTEKDFGKYSCFAKNSLGKNEKQVTLVKTPAIREFIKPEKANKDVVLTWKVESKSAILEHELQYKKKGVRRYIFFKFLKSLLRNNCPPSPLLLKINNLFLQPLSVIPTAVLFISSYLNHLPILN